MSLILKFEKGHPVPVISCDFCELEITDATAAVLYWRAEAYRLGKCEPFMVHKHCVPSHKAWNAGLEHSMELASYLALLLKHAGLTGKKLAQAMKQTNNETTEKSQGLVR